MRKPDKIRQGYLDLHCEDCPESPEYCDCRVTIRVKLSIWRGLGEPQTVEAYLDRWNQTGKTQGRLFDEPTKGGA